MIIETDKFGIVDIQDNRVIDFPTGLLGFEGLKRFIIMEIEETKPIYWLQSTEDKYISLPLILTFDIFNDYYIDIRDSDLEGLQFESNTDLSIMNVVVIPEKIEGMTVNLAAPIVINVKRGIAKQIIVDAAELPIRFPVYEAVMKSLEGGGENAGIITEEG